MMLQGITCLFQMRMIVNYWFFLSREIRLVCAVLARALYSTL